MKKSKRIAGSFVVILLFASSCTKNDVIGNIDDKCQTTTSTLFLFEDRVNSMMQNRKETYNDWYGLYLVENKMYEADGMAAPIIKPKGMVAPEAFGLNTGELRQGLEWFIFFYTTSVDPVDGETHYSDYYIFSSYPCYDESLGVSGKITMHYSDYAYSYKLFGLSKGIQVKDNELRAAFMKIDTECLLGWRTCYYLTIFDELELVAEYYLCSQLDIGYDYAFKSMSNITYGLEDLRNA